MRILDGFLAITPIVIIYYITISNAISNGGDVPIQDFTPDAKYAANYWVILLKVFPESLDLIKNTSLFLSLIGQIIVMGVLYRLYYVKKLRLHPISLLTIPLVVFFATFYQHMPEYFLMLWPLVAYFSTKIWQQFLLAAIFSIAWAPRIFHGMKRVTEEFGTAAQARTEIVAPYLQLEGHHFESLNQIALISQSIIYILMLCWLWKMFLILGVYRMRLET